MPIEDTQEPSAEIDHTPELVEESKDAPVEAAPVEVQE